METKFSPIKPMKTNILKLFICALVMTSFYAARADFIKSTYVGPSDGNWGDPANWSPAIVPNNGGGHSFAATIANVFLTLDLDVTVNRLTFNPGDGNNDSSSAEQRRSSFALTTISPPRTRRSGPVVLSSPTRKAKDVTVDLGELADFSGTTLGPGGCLLRRCKLSPGEPRR